MTINFKGANKTGYRYVYLSLKKTNVNRQKYFLYISLQFLGLQKNKMMGKVWKT